METVQALREHVQSSDDFQNATEFLDILNKTEMHLNSFQLDGKAKVASCINLEGIDGVGKTTVANALACSPHLSGRLLSVPGNLKSFRPYFDKQNEILKRQFFHLWDIIVSNELFSSPDTAMIILDRYWPTTTTYRRAYEIESTSLDEDTRWPEYLVKPSHIVYLYLNEEERQRRINHRHSTIPISAEEKRIASDSQFRLRLDKIYRQIPDIYPTDSNQPTKDIVENILQWIKKSVTKTK